MELAVPIVCQDRERNENRDAHLAKKLECQGECRREIQLEVGETWYQEVGAGGGPCNC